MIHMDGLALCSAVEEMRRELQGGRVERIAQPGAFDLLFTIRSGGKNHRLLCSAAPESARVLMVQKPEETQLKKASPLLLAVRRRLVHARLAEISMPTPDRVVRFSFEGIDEIGNDACFTLVAEIMGKHSNLILLDRENTVIESARRVYADMSSVRTILPKAVYIAPPAQEKKNPLEASLKEIESVLREANGKYSGALVGNYLGISPATAQFLCDNVTEPKVLSKQIFEYFQTIALHQEKPAIFWANETPLGVMAAILPMTGVRQTPMPSICAAYEQAYKLVLSRRSLEQQRLSLYTMVKEHLNRLYRRLAIQEEALLSAQNYVQLRHYGDLIMAYAYEISKGVPRAKLIDYETGQAVEIVLDAGKTAPQNAQAYYKKASRKKATLTAAQAQKEEILPQIAYLESVLQMVEMAGEEEALWEIREELSNQGILKKQGSRPGDRQRPSSPVRFLTPDGVEILAGRNNRQNDMLTTKLAKSTDVWFHVQGMPGSHVIAREKLPLKSNTLKAALHIAAFYSKGRHSSNVPVDMTEVKYVHKPSGAKPGFVIYTQQKTHFVTPDEDYVKSMIQAEE